VSSNIGRWFNSCKAKASAERRGCFRVKGESYLAFCDLYKTSEQIKDCRISIFKSIGHYCSRLSGEAEKDCELSAGL
jgi:hypothetical protein